MRIFLAGATGVIGRRLVPLLLADGHDVVGLTRSESNHESLRTAGVEPVVADALDASAISAAVAGATPEVVIHQLTAIPARIDPRRMDTQFELTDRLRTEGTRNLVLAAESAGARRIVAQSIAFAYAPGDGAVKVESDSLFLDAPAPFTRSAKAVASLEQEVLDSASVEGVVLRYGYFYGPGTSYDGEGSMAQDVRARRLPIVGGGTGVWPFVHIDDAAKATALAVTGGAPGIYNIVDDEPAAVSEWIPAYAAALGAPPPRRVPAFVGRLVAGRYAVHMMTQAPGASNAKAKAALGWEPAHPSWREGFADSL